MKMKLFAAAVLLSLSLVASAQADEGKSKSALLSSNKLIGASIYNADDEAIADVNTIVFDKAGNAMFVIAGVGGVVGVGESEVAIPWKALSCECKVDGDTKTCRAAISMTLEKLEKAPVLKAADYAELSDEKWLLLNAKHFSCDAPSETPTADNLLCVTTLTDVNIAGTDGKSVGHLDALVFDMAKGSVAYGIVGDGGTLGVGEKYTAVPYSSLTFKRGEDKSYTASLNANLKSVKSAPRVTPKEYPELDLESIRMRIEKHFDSKSYPAA